jgi:hypothetical protein
MLFSSLPQALRTVTRSIDTPIKLEIRKNMLDSLYVRTEKVRLCLGMINNGRDTRVRCFLSERGLEGWWSCGRRLLLLRLGFRCFSIGCCYTWRGASYSTPSGLACVHTLSQSRIQFSRLKRCIREFFDFF